MSKKRKVEQSKARKHLRKACHHATGMSTSEMIADQGEYIRRFVAAGMALIAARVTVAKGGE